MEDKKIDELIERLEKYREKLAKSKRASKKFLVGAGIITKKGNLTKNYKGLCIPQEQA